MLLANTPEDLQELLTAWRTGTEGWNRLNIEKTKMDGGKDNTTT